MIPRESLIRQGDSYLVKHGLRNPSHRLPMESGSLMRRFYGLVFPRLQRSPILDQLTFQLEGLLGTLSPCTFEERALHCLFFAVNKQSPMCPGLAMKLLSN